MLRLLAIALLALGCASGGGETAPAETPSVLVDGTRIGQLHLSAASDFSPEQREVLGQYQGLERLESELTLALRARSAWDPAGPLSLDVVLDGFRLRSNATSIWFGSLAGADSVAAEVSVRRGDAWVKTFHTDTSSIMGGLAMPGRGQRLNRLLVELAKRIADGL